MQFHPSRSQTLPVMWISSCFQSKSNAPTHTVAFLPPSIGERGKIPLPELSQGIPTSTCISHPAADVTRTISVILNAREVTHSPEGNSQQGYHHPSLNSLSAARLRYNFRATRDAPSSLPQPPHYWCVRRKLHLWAEQCQCVVCACPVNQHRNIPENISLPPSALLKKRFP